MSDRKQRRPLITTRQIKEVIADNRAHPHIELYRSLVSPANYPYKCTPLTKERFGKSELDHVHLGVQPSPFKNGNAIKAMATPEQIRDILLEDLDIEKAKKSGGGVIYWRQGGNGGEDEDAVDNEEDAAEVLIRNLTNPKFVCNGIVPSLPSPTMDRIAAGQKEVWTNAMTISQFSTSIFPSGNLIPLQHHNESHSFSTLLVGQIMWIIWPPTNENINKLQQSYDAYAKDNDEKHLNVADQLIGGLTFVQCVGEGLKMPPYCIMLGVVLRTSCLATYQILSASRFVLTLQKIPFLESWWKTEAGGPTKRLAFGRALLPQIRRILAGIFDTYAPDAYLDTSGDKRVGPLQDLLLEWDDVKCSVVNIMDEVAAAALNASMKEFLRAMYGSVCAMCGQNFEDKATQVEGHFDDKHWPVMAVKDDSGRMDSFGPEHELNS